MFKKIIALSFITLSLPNNLFAADLKKVQAEITFIEHDKNKDLAAKIKAYDQLFHSIDDNDVAENMAWKGVTKAAQTKFIKDEEGKFAALSNVKISKKYLLAAVEKSRCVANGAALNALGTIHYRVPPWPIGFGSDTKARSYFEEAIKCFPNNPDIIWRRAEFLADNGEAEKALTDLKKASKLLAKRARSEDKYKKLDVEKLIVKIENEQL